MRLLVCYLLLLGLSATALGQSTPYFTASARLLLIDHNLTNTSINGRGPSPGLEISPDIQVNEYLGFSIPLRAARVNTVEDTRHYIASIGVRARFFPLTNEIPVAPYFIGGFSFEGESCAKPNLQFPFGPGLSIRLNDESWASVQGEYRVSNKDLRTNVVASIGYTRLLNFKAKDSDRDGTPDDVDPCPNQFGPRAYNGCPDSDGDGTPDGQDQCPNLIGLPAQNGCPDTDMDGIIDAEDACPELKGLAATNGCPDRDGDGIHDGEDKCPREPGPAATAGCPDGDGDGIVDSRDNCPGEPGSKRFRGCPDTDGDGLPDDTDRCPELAGNMISGCPDKDDDGFNDTDDNCPDTPGPLAGCPDTDGDNIADKDDPCPRQAGPAGSNGCPDIAVTDEVVRRVNEVARNIEFESGSDVLTKRSFVRLAEIARIMSEYGRYSLQIDGHTDNEGDPAGNLALSELRAESCKTALIQLGVAEARIRTTGYGSTQPLQPNDTPEGMAENRRVEFELVIR